MESVLKQEFDSERAGDWAKRFSSMTRAGIIECPYVTGAFEFIQYFSHRYPLYVASATPQDELDIILQKRELHQYFKGIYGAPTSKKMMFEYITNDEKIIPKDILYIGDSREDYEVAKDVGCGFIGRKSSYDFSGLEVECFNNLTEIKSYILDKA
jgi:phosphoglycolate phosphatase-like HAD superfamily hydrolase